MLEAVTLVAGLDDVAVMGQVAFGTLILILGALYAFLAKGWLR